MDPSSRIAAAVDELRGIVARASTRSIAQRCVLVSLDVANNFKRPTRLESPSRQMAFLLGLALTTPEPDSGEMSNADWDHVQSLLNDSFSAYQLLFYPGPSDDIVDRAIWPRHREVALPAFMHFVGTDLVATPEQVSARIERYLVPFDAEIRPELGLSASKALEIAASMADLRSSKRALCRDSRALALLKAGARSPWQPIPRWRPS